MTTEVINAEDSVPEQSLAELMQATGRAAVAAAQVLAHAPSPQKEQGLRAAAAAIRKRRSELVIANHFPTPSALYSPNGCARTGCGFSACACHSAWSE